MDDDTGHILTNEIVVNYKKNDKDNCLHFLTHLGDASKKNISSMVSSSAKKIFTSNFNAWFLTTNYSVIRVRNDVIEGFDFNKSYKIKYNNKRFIFSFLDSKYSAGSVALLLHGEFGSYLYTGPFCFYKSFLTLPPLLPVIEKKVLSRIYYDATFHDKKFSFKNFDDNINEIINLIRRFNDETIFIVSENIATYSVVAEIAVHLKERIYAENSEMKIMEKLGYALLFKNDCSKSRILLKTCWRESEIRNVKSIWIELNWHTHNVVKQEYSCKRSNVYHFHFYAHTNTSDGCFLMAMLEPKKVIYIYPECPTKKNSHKTVYSRQPIKTSERTIVKCTPILNCINPILHKHNQTDLPTDISFTSPYNNLNVNVSLNVYPNNDGTNESLCNNGTLKIQNLPQINLLNIETSDIDKNESFEKSKRRNCEQVEISHSLHVSNDIDNVHPNKEGQTMLESIHHFINNETYSGTSGPLNKSDNFSVDSNLKKKLKNENCNKNNSLPLVDHDYGIPHGSKITSKNILQPVYSSFQRCTVEVKNEKREIALFHEKKNPICNELIWSNIEEKMDDWKNQQVKQSVYEQRGSHLLTNAGNNEVFGKSKNKSDEKVNVISATGILTPKATTIYNDNIQNEENFQKNSPKDTANSTDYVMPSSYKKLKIEDDIRPIIQDSVTAATSNDTILNENYNVIECLLRNVLDDVVENISCENTNHVEKPEINKCNFSKVHRKSTRISGKNIDNPTTSNDAELSEKNYTKLRKVLRSEVPFIKSKIKKQKMEKLNFNCFVLVKGMPKEYYYCNKQMCYLPGFFGFKRPDLLYKLTNKKLLRRRHMLKNLIDLKNR